MKVKFNIKRYFQVLGITLAIIAALAAAALGFDFAALRTGQETADNTNTADIERNAERINVLLMGVDVDGLRTDAIMLVQYDVQKNEVNMLSIPRDTKMYIGNRYQKINAAHAFVKDGKVGGPEATVEAVSRITGVPINYYVDFTFDAVAHVINELGPVTFTIPDLYGDGVGMVYDDPVQGLHINLPPGTYELDGQKAVWLMRYRHGNKVNGHFKGYVNGDADRVEMQHEFLKALVDQKVNASLILKLPAIFKEVSSEIKTNLTARDIVKYAKYLKGFTSNGIHAYSLPGEYGDDSSNGSIWKINIAETQKLIQDVFGYDASGITVNNPDDPDATTPPNCITDNNVSDTPGVAGVNSETGEVYEAERYGSVEIKSSSSGSASSGSSSSGNSSSGSSSSGSISGSSSSGSSSSNGSSSGSSSSSSSSGSASSGNSSSDSSSEDYSDSSEEESETSSSGSSSSSGSEDYSEESESDTSSDESGSEE